jgi:sugar (pentulose or hexulose) kinase
VIAGSIDSYVDIGGIGALNPGSAFLLAGTTLILGRIVAAPLPAGDLRVTKAIGEGYFLGGWTSAFGGMLDWANSLADNSSDQRSGLSELLILPYIAGERAPVWDPSAAGVILGIKGTTGIDSIRTASREAIVLSAMDIAGRLESLTGRTAHYGASGGVLQSPGMTQLLADGLNATIDVIECGGGIAAAQMAAAGTGLEIPRRVARTYHPRTELHDCLLARLELYRDLYAATSPLMKRFEDIISRERQ